MAGLLATLALALAMFGPPAQAAPCADDLQVAAAAADSQVQLRAETPGEPCDEGCCPCVCCHAHPAGAVGPPEGAALAAPSEGAAGHVLTSAPAPASSPASGLMRPPRA